MFDFDGLNIPSQPHGSHAGPSTKRLKTVGPAGLALARAVSKGVSW